MDKLVSVIMSTYNEPLEWIQESIVSVVSQTYTNFEFIIVLDNPNNQEIREYIEEISLKYSNIHVIKNEKNIGLVSSLNKALDLSEGYYVARMDADDIAELDRIAKQVEYLEKNKLDLVFSGLKIIDEESKELYCTNLKEMKPNDVSKALGITNISNHPTWLLKKEVYDQLNGYREVKYTEDYDFTLRVLHNNYIIGKMDGYVLKYRIRDSSISRTYSLLQYLNSEVVRKAYHKSLIMDDIAIKNMLNKVVLLATETEIEKFKIAENNFSIGVEKIKISNKIIGAYEILRSIMSSKYYRKKMLQLLKYKIYI